MKTRFFVSVFLCVAFIFSSVSLGIADEQTKTPKEAKKPAAKAVKKEGSKKTQKSAPKDSTKADSKKKDTKKSDAKKPADAAKAKPAEEKAQPEAKKAEAKPEQSKPAAPPTVSVKKERFSIEVKLNGVFAAKKGTEIAIEPESWSTYMVLKAVEHGTKVKKGDLLIACDSEKIDEALENARRDFQIADLAFKQKVAEYELIKKFTPMEFAELKRSHKWSKEDEAYFWEKSLPLQKESLEMSFEYSKFNLEYTKEELRQLEKMYKADDLTEETEEIILKRARESVKQAEFYFKQAKARYEREKATLMPRELQERKERSKRREMGYSVAEKLFPMLVKQRELEMAKAKIAHEKAKEKLEDLAADRKWMTIKAPCGGTVYYGTCIHGKWANASSVASKLKPNGKLAAKEVLLTILQEGPLRVEADFSEKELRDVREGIKGSVKPTAYPDMKLEGIVNRVVPLPSAGTSFHTELNLARHSEDALLRPGMTCCVELASYEKKNALTLPPKSIKIDEETDKPYVYLVKEGKEPRRREITVGRKTAKAVEILKGLAEGDKVLESPPNGEETDKKADAAKKPPLKKEAAKKEAVKQESSKADCQKKASPKKNSKKS